MTRKVGVKRLMWKRKEKAIKRGNSLNYQLNERKIRENKEKRKKRVKRKEVRVTSTKNKGRSKVKKK